jgi:ATP-binding cassette subfamily B protein
MKAAAHDRGVSSDHPEESKTFGIGDIFRVFLRTWPYLKPNAIHILIWFLLQMVSFTAVSLVSVFVFDVLNNKIFLGGPLEPAQATFFLLDNSYVDVEALTPDQRVVVRNRLGIYTAIGLVFNYLVLQIAVLSYYFTWITQRINQYLRVTMVERAEHLSLRYHSHARTGDAIYRIYQDSATITTIVDTVILDPINIISKLVLALFIICLFNPWLVVICLLATIPIVVIVAWFTPRLQRLSRSARETNSNLTSRIQEAFANIRVIKANEAETTIINQFDTDSNRALDAALRLRLEMIVMWMLVATTGGASLLLCDYLMAGWTISARDTWLAGVVTLVGFAVWNLGAYQAANNRNAEYIDWGWSLVQKWSIMQDMAVALDRAYLLLDLKADVENPETPVPVPTPIDNVRFEGVRFGYDPDQPILTGVDLAARAGTITAIVGITGSGKSTLMSLLLRLYDADQGSIAINGTDLKEMAIEDLRANVAIALQQNVLFAATIADNISYAADTVSRDDVEAAARVACADEFIRESENGYDTELGERGGKLSTGQRQRLSIARAIVRDTPILILDEPTASLDAETEQQLMRNLNEWGRDRVVFLITHRLSTIRDADQIAFLEDGEIKEIGDHDTLVALDNGRYRNFVEAETGGAGEASVSEVHRT